MAQQLEGTLVVNDGESEFVQCLKSKGVSTDSIQKLTASGLNTLDLLQSMEDDFDEVVKACGINVIDKVKLRNVIRGLAQVIVDKEETSAILEMQNRLQSIKNSIDMVANTKQKIDDQVVTYTKTIKSIFGKLHQLLNQREAKLIQSLNAIASEKRQKLENISKDITKQSVETEQKTNSCRKRLRKSIEFDQIEARKKEILQVAAEVNNIKVVTKDAAVITNNKINVTLDEAVMIKTINAFGNVSADIIPIIMSLSDARNGGVKIKWKLNGGPEQKNNINDKIKVEWREMEAKDDEQDEKKNWNNKDIQVHSLQNINETIVANLKFNSATADFAFKMRYYKNKWSAYSNVVTVKLKLSFRNGLKSVMIKGSTLQTLFFTKVLPDSLKSKTFSLLLRGSEHGFDVAAFRSRCLDTGPCLMVVSSKEYDRIFGGYTSIGWDGNTHGAYQTDANAFMYFMSENQNQAYRFPVKKKAEAIYIQKNQIGAFGGHGDLGWDPNGSWANCNRYAFDYSILGNDKTLLAGGPNNWHVKDYEIWKIT